MTSSLNIDDRDARLGPPNNSPTGFPLGHSPNKLGLCPVFVCLEPLLPEEIWRTTLLDRHEPLNFSWLTHFSISSIPRDHGRWIPHMLLIKNGGLKTNFGKILMWIMDIVIFMLDLHFFPDDETACGLGSRLVVATNIVITQNKMRQNHGFTMIQHVFDAHVMGQHDV